MHPVSTRTTFMIDVCHMHGILYYERDEDGYYKLRIPLRLIG